MSILAETFTLNNTVKIPKIGFGTAPLKGEEAYQAVLHAIKAGYRHIDTAQNYANEREVGKAIKASNIPRNAFFITSKLRAEIKNYEAAIAAFKETLKNLDTDYLDLFLIHAPWPWDDKFSNHQKGNIEVYKALEKLYNDGLVRAIGVSNFNKEDLENILTHCKTAPHVNQIKYHIGYDQTKTLSYCKEHNILVEAYSPFGRGELFKDKSLTNAALSLNVTPAQLALRYILDKGILPLPRSKNLANIKANAALDFKIPKSINKELNTLNIASIEFGTVKQK